MVIINEYSIVKKCDNSQKFLLEVVELICMEYNITEIFCDNSQ